MVNFKNRFFLIIFCCVAIFLNVIADQKNLAANNYNNTSKVVSELIGIVSNNPTLATQINDALKGQKKASFWHGKAIRDMYRFFNQWLVFNPTVDDPEKFIVEFDNFANSPTGKIVLENNVFQSWLISFMEARGEYLNSKASAKHIKQWQSSPKINIKDYIIPKGGYKSFNDFFTRKLKPGARPISNPKNQSILVSPADCSMRIILNRATKYSSFKLKGDRLNIRQSLNNEPFAKYFIGGKATTCLLWFNNYHRFHSPVTGKIIAAGQFTGSYNYNFKDKNWFRDLSKHRRGYFIFKTSKFGLVAMIPVGFWGVGSIKFTRSTGDFVKKGEELGYFEYGGSSIVLLFEPNKVKFSIPLKKDKEIPVRMGQKIGVAK